DVVVGDRDAVGGDDEPAARTGTLHLLVRGEAAGRLREAALGDDLDGGGLDVLGGGDGSGPRDPSDDVEAESSSPPPQAAATRAAAASTATSQREWRFIRFLRCRGRGNPAGLPQEPDEAPLTLARGR